MLTYVIKFGLPIWYARTPLFWLPYGWLPYYAEWLVSFPLAPLGSVSVWTWRVACAAVIRMAWDTGIALVGLVVAAERGGGTRLTKKSQEEKEKEKAAPPATADGPNEAQGKGKAES